MEKTRSVSPAEVILAVGPSAAPLVAKLAGLITPDHAPAETVCVADSPGDALRYLHRHGATASLICVTHDNLRHCSPIISAVRDRLPGLPLLAIAAEHDAQLERSVREAGAPFYFALSSDAPEIIRTLETLTTSRPLAYDDPVPPRARGRPSLPIHSH